MKILLKSLLLALLTFAVSRGEAQIPPEYYGIYAGKAKVTSYFNSTNKPAKLKAALSLLINPDNSTLTIVYDNNTFEEFPVEFIQIGTNLFFTSGPVGFAFTGRLEPKGKPGKRSFKGVGGHQFDSFGFITESKFKLKQIPS